MPKKKRFMVIPREKGAARHGIRTTRGHRKFNQKTGVMYLSEKSEAEEVEARYGLKGSRDVFVYEDDKYATALEAGQWEMKRNQKGGDDLKLIHHYTFSVPDPTQPGGNERVRVKTNDGFTWVSRVVALEEGLEIIPPKRVFRPARREVVYG